MKRILTPTHDGVDMRGVVISRHVQSGTVQ